MHLVKCHDTISDRAAKSAYLATPVRHTRLTRKTLHVVARSTVRRAFAFGLRMVYARYF